MVHLPVPRPDRGAASQRRGKEPFWNCIAGSRRRKGGKAAISSLMTAKMGEGGREGAGESGRVKRWVWFRERLGWKEGRARGRVCVRVRVIAG